MKACTVNSTRRVVMPTEVVSYPTDLKLAGPKTLRQKLSTAHQEHMVAITYRPVKHATIVLQVIRMEADTCRLNSLSEEIFKEVPDHLLKRIVDMFLQATVTRLVQDRLKPTKAKPMWVNLTRAKPIRAKSIRVRETTQQTHTQVGRRNRPMPALSRIAQRQPSRYVLSQIYMILN
jgi:hypothetical protein